MAPHTGRQNRRGGRRVVAARSAKGRSGIASAAVGRVLLAFFLLALVPATVAIGNARYEGVASCAGSTCHGRAEGNGAVVRQDEISIWQERSSTSGAHSRAFAILQSNRSKQIAQTLGIGPATQAPACLGCHSTSVPQAQRGVRFLTTDGVGCESCHGASGGWLAEHYARPATHASNVAAGLIPLEQPKARANVCLDCHFGSTKPGQFVTHQMMAAGHPRISFELDLFSALQQHHDIDEDYTARKGDFSSVRFWAVGQAEAVRRSASMFAQPKFGMEGAFPQLYFFDCHSCHRTITDAAERKLTFETNPERPIPFANPPFNDENIIMLSTVAGALVPGAADNFRAASRNFHSAMGRSGEDARGAAVKLSQSAEQLSSALNARGYGTNDAFTVIRIVSDRTTSNRFTDYAGATQAVMAVDTLLNALVREGRITIGAASSIRADINQAYAAVKEPNSFRPAAFRRALQNAANAIGRLQ